MNIRNIPIPQLLLIGLVCVLLIVVVLAASNSTAAFGTYNSAWDGTAELRETVTTTGAEPIVGRNVSQYRTLQANETVGVILSPADPYSQTDVQTIQQFLQEGGTLLIADDFGTHTNGLLAAIGAEARITGLPLRDEQQAGPSPAFPRVQAVGNESVTAGVDQLMFNHGSTVEPSGATPVAVSSEFSYLDRNRNGALDESESLGSRPVVTIEPVGSGRVIVVSDPSLFLNSMLSRSDNEAFARSVVGVSDYVLIDVSHRGGVPPLIGLQLTLQETPTLSSLAGILSVLALLAVARGEEILEWLFGRESDEENIPTLSETEIAEYLRTTHPDWDEDRINRVTNSLMVTRNKGQIDERSS